MTCGMYLDGGGSPGDPCDPATFGMCSDGAGCCNTYTCDAATRMVVETPPLCDGPCIMRTDCSGFVPPPEPDRCRSAVDCRGPGPHDCLAPGDTPPPCCGICFMGTHECGTSDDCAPGSVCETREIACSCDGPNTFCVPDCRGPSSGCTDGVCDGTTGLCRPPNCTEGVACPASATCDPSSPDADDVTGCVRRPCTDDSECDCGACVNGTCRDGVGTCMEILFCA